MVYKIRMNGKSFNLNNLSPEWKKKVMNRLAEKDPSLLNGLAFKIDGEAVTPALVSKLENNHKLMMAGKLKPVEPKAEPVKEEPKKKTVVEKVKDAVKPKKVK